MRRLFPLVIVTFVSCGFDRADRWTSSPVANQPVCPKGATRCNGALDGAATTGSDGRR
jgi:hypothetical protein